MNSGAMTEKMTIEKAAHEDLEKILQLQYLAYQSEAALFGTSDIPPLKQTLEEVRQEYQNGVILKMVPEDGTIIGSVRGREENGTVYIGKLMVHPDCRGRGCGTRLLHEIESCFPGKRYELFTSTRSEANIRMYQRNGYRIFDRKPVKDELVFVYLRKTESPAMSNLMAVRPLRKEETEAALRLAWKVFIEYESPDYAPEGTDEFRKALNDDKFLVGIRYYGAFDAERLVGIIGIREEKAHICFFFVDGAYHRRGIGTRLFKRMREDFADRTITLNSSPYGLPFYKALGFNPTDNEQTINGIRFTPMVFSEKGD